MLFMFPVFIMLLGLFIPEFHRLADRHPKLRRFYLRVTCTRPENLTKKLESSKPVQQQQQEALQAGKGGSSAENILEM